MKLANPLLEFGGLTRFDQLRAEHVTPAIDELLAAACGAVDSVTRSVEAPSWNWVVEPIEDATDRLARAWSAVAHVTAVVDTPEWRAQYNHNLPRITAFWTELAQNEALYARFKALAALEDVAQGPPARRRVVENELRDFRLGGARPAPQRQGPVRG